MRRILRVISTALITAGLVVLADAGVTLAWQEPVSAIYTEIRQAGAAGELDDLEQSFSDQPVDLPHGVSPERGAEILGRQLADRIEDGEAIGRIEFPEIGVDAVVVEGTDPGTLQKGPGHYPETELPGQGSTIGIAGHRTTYLAPFRDLNELENGDEITIQLPYGDFIYTVEKTRIVEPTDVQIVRDVGRERLVLTACHPLYSAAQRIAVFGRLDEIALTA